jgi:hypothetical protein
MRSFDIVNIVNNVICQTGVDRIPVCHDSTCMRRSEHPLDEPNYRRLSRYDVNGLIWLLHGRSLPSPPTVR